jgi:hypothetical protein
MTRAVKDGVDVNELVSCRGCTSTIASAIISNIIKKMFKDILVLFSNAQAVGIDCALMPLSAIFQLYLLS